MGVYHVKGYKYHQRCTSRGEWNLKKKWKHQFTNALYHQLIVFATQQSARSSDN